MNDFDVKSHALVIARKFLRALFMRYYCSHIASGEHQFKDDTS